MIGEGGLLQALHVHGYSIVDSRPDYVVVGEGRMFNMESIEAAVNMILGGAKLIATNLDPNCPTNSGTRPGCGAIVKMLEEATGAEAFSVGKPSPVIMREARKSLGLRTEEITMVGDTMSTRHPRGRPGWLPGPSWWRRVSTPGRISTASPTSPIRSPHPSPTSTRKFSQAARLPLSRCQSSRNFSYISGGRL